MADADPITDLAAAQAFTAEYGYVQRMGGLLTHPVQAVITYGPRPSGLPRCRHKKFDHFRSHQCASVGKVTLADGTTWCGVHAPAAVAKRAAAKAQRDAAWRADFDAKMKANDEARRRAAAHPRLVDALRMIAAGHNDPRTLAAQVLADAGEPELEN